MLSSYYPLQEPYENYVINKEGIIKNTLRNNHVNKCWKNSKGYLYFCLWNYKTQKKKTFFQTSFISNSIYY